MSIKVKESSMVLPAKETPRRSLWLSNIDLVIRMPFTHTPSVHIYRDTKPHGSSKQFFDASILKEALSRALVPFYPMAGRLKRNEKSGRIEIDCNARGALFVEAETTHLLVDFGGEDYLFTPTLELRKVVIPSCDYKTLSSFPLVMVQLTRFRCGGVVLGFAMHHQLADGTGYLHFVNSWARLARGLDLEVLPFHDRIPHLTPRHPPIVKFDHHPEYDPPQALLGDSQLHKLFETPDETKVSLIKLSKSQITALKLKAVSHEKPEFKPTNYEVLAAHVWQCVCKARGLVDGQEVRLYTPVNGRSRLKEPALPEGYCGNAIFSSVCIAKVKDITHNPLWYVANKIHEMLRRVTDEEYLRSRIDYLELQSDLAAVTRGAHHYRCPNLNVNYHAHMGFYEPDYGWGRPIFGGHGGIGYEGQSIIMRNPNEDGSFLVAINLFEIHMPLFEKYLYEF